MGVKRKLEDSGVAVALTEANQEPGVTSPFRVPSSPRGVRRRLQDTFSAIAFAEANLGDVAQAMFGRYPKMTYSPSNEVHGELDDFLSDVGLSGVRLRYCVIEI